MFDRARVRKIVVMARDQSKVSSAKLWLDDDSTGCWEETAIKTLESTREQAETKGMVPDAVDKEIATYIAYLAVETLRRDKIKKSPENSK